MDGWMDGWVGEWVGGWVGEFMYLIPSPLIFQIFLYRYHFEYFWKIKDMKE